MSTWCARLTRLGESGVPPPMHCWHSWTVTTPPTLSTPAGWYQDPSDATAQRWWNGATWTEHVAFPQSAPSPLLPEPSSGSEAGVVGPPQGSWGLGDVGWTVLVVIGMFIVGIALFVGVAALHPSALDGTALDYADPLVAWMLVVSQTLVMAGLAGWPLIAGRWKGDGWRTSFGFLVNRRSWIVGGVGGIVTFVVLLTVTMLSSLVLGQEVDSAAAEVVSGIADVTWAYAIFLALIAIGAPFVEEISFRGLLWGAIVKKGWSPWLATSVSAVAFGLFHFEPLRLVALIAAGFVLGSVRHYAGIGASMLSHAIVNTIGVVTLLLAR